MNIAFIINRKMTLKFLKDIIDVSLEKNLNIYLLFDYVNSRHKGKWREYPSLDTFQKENEKISKITFFKYSEIEEISKKQKIDYIISIVSPSAFNIKKNNLTSKWVLLQNGIDMFHYSKDFDNIDYIFFYSEYWKNKYESNNSNNQKLFCYGNHQFNNEIIFDRKKILEKYNLGDKKIFLFLPWGPVNLYNFSSKINKLLASYTFNWPDIDDNFYNFKKLLYKILSKFLYTEINVLKNIYKHCKENDIYLIIKTRSKRVIDQDYIKFCDLVLYDEEILKPTIYELLYISDTVFTALSTVVGESIYFRNKTIVLNHKFFNFDNEKYIDFFSKEYFNWDKLSKIVDVNEFKNKSLENLINFAFSNSERNKYLTKFFNFDENINVPKKIIEQLEKDYK